MVTSTGTRAGRRSATSATSPTRPRQSAVISQPCTPGLMGWAATAANTMATSTSGLTMRSACRAPRATAIQSRTARMPAAASKAHPVAVIGCRL